MSAILCRLFYVGLWRKFVRSTWHLVRLSQSKSIVIILCRSSDE